MCNLAKLSCLPQRLKSTFLKKNFKQSFFVKLISRKISMKWISRKINVIYWNIFPIFSPQCGVRVQSRKRQDGIWSIQI